MAARGNGLLPDKDNMGSGASFPAGAGAGAGGALHVSSLSYSVQRKPASKKRNWRRCCGGRKGYADITAEETDDSDRPVLNDVSLHLQPGGMLAVAGSSGSGKTSLLDCIAQRTLQRSSTIGAVYLDQQPLTEEVFRARGAYVMQDDTLLPFLTVRETLTYVLRLRLDCSAEEHQRKIDHVVQELGLKAVESSVIGGTEVKGISGGERRRVSIAVQLLLEPDLLLLDEPTSGLDSHTAHHLVVMLAQLAASKRHTIVLTIHQARSEIFEALDQIMILSRGDTTFCGPAKSLVSYFTSVGFTCPAFTNPLDQYVDLCSIDKTTRETKEATIAQVDELVKQFKRSDLARRITNACPNPTSSAPPPVEAASGRSPRWHRKALALTSRMNFNLLRAKTGMQMRAFQVFIYALILFIFILHLGNDQRSVQDRSGVFYQLISAPVYIAMLSTVALFPPLRNSMSREVRDGLYRTPVFLFSYLLHILPFLVFSSLFLSAVFYWAFGFANKFVGFASFTAVLFFSQFVGESVGLIMLAIFTKAKMATSMSSMFFSFTALLCSGFIRNFPSMPVGIERLTYIGVQKYTSEILVAYEYPGLQLTCQDTKNGTAAAVPCRYADGEAYLKQNFPTAVADLGRNYLCLLGYGAGMFAIAMLIFSLKSRAKRQ